MPTAQDIADIFERIAPRESGIAGDELGFLFGDPGQEIRGLACLWNPDTLAIGACASQGLNMIICHEQLDLPEQTSPWYQGPGPSEIFSNRARRGLLEAHGMVVYRSHSNWDALRTDGIGDQAVAALGIEGLRTIARQKFFSVEEVPQPITVGELRERATRGLQYDANRLYGDPDRKISRFAFLIGGFAESQWHMPQAARDLGAQALIVGGIYEFIVIAALEMGLPVIETLHSVSETPGVRRQAQMLAERLPDIPVRFVPSGSLALGAAR